MHGGEERPMEDPEKMAENQKSGSPVINGERLRRLFDGVNAFGRLDEGRGFDRRALSDADMEARRWFAAQMEDSGLTVRWDGAGNVFGRFGRGDGAVVMAGSHLDTVPGGGAFDGALGTCVALESVRAMQDAGLEPASPIEIVVTSDEEGRFGGMLGSQAIAGQISSGWIARAVDADGVRLADAMLAQHLHPGALADAAREPGSIKAFLELHVEQGPVLEKAGEAIGIVERVTGICDWQITLNGVANHSGTTPMDARSDAFAGLAEIAATIASIIRIVGGENSRVTVGKVDILPNSPHTIPAKAVFSLDIRDTSERVMRAIAAALRALVARVAEARGLEATIDETSWLSPVELDPELVRIVEEEASRLDLTYRRMASGAGHDAQTMQSFCPAALIFVPSRNGISHAPEEATDWADVEKGARLYLAALMRFCAMPARELVALSPEATAAVPAPAVMPAAAAMPAAVAGSADETGEERRPESDEGVPAEDRKRPLMAEDEDIDFDFDLDEIAIEDEK